MNGSMPPQGRQVVQLQCSVTGPRPYDFYNSQGKPWLLVLTGAFRLLTVCGTWLAMPNRSVYCNGEFVPEAAARVSLFDAGFLYGDTAFEMTRTFNGTPFRLREHLQRLQNSLNFLGIDPGLSLDEWERFTLETYSQNRSTEAADVDWHIRHDVTRGPLELYSTVFPEGLHPTVLISCWPLIKHMGRLAPSYDLGVSVVVSPQQSIPPTLIDPRAKTRSRIHFQLAQMAAKKQGPVWPVLTDTQGHLTEGPSWNILVLRDGVLYSPSSRSILHGISREVTFQAAKTIGLQTAEADMGREFVLQADEIYCTATSFGMLPCIAFEGQPISGGRPGPVYTRLLDQWRQIIGCDFVAQAHSYTSRVADWEASERAAWPAA